jgi:hypothetical protein
MTKRTQKEIDDVLNWCDDTVETGRSHFPGMTYEEGVQAAIDWLQGRGERPDQE